MSKKQFSETPGGIALPQDLAQGQLQAMQRNMLRVQAAIEIMGKVTSIAYMEATNSARTSKFNEIKSRLKAESPEYTTDEELNQKAMEEFNKEGQNVNMQIPLGQCADLSVKAAEILITRLGI